MMKRKLAALGLVFCLALCACGQPAGDAPKDPYDTDDVTALLDAGIFSETPEELDSDIACEVMGVDSTLVSSCRVCIPTSTNAEAVALFILNDAADAETVKSACETWIADQIESYQDYAPAHVPKLEGAVVSVRQNTVLVVVGSDPAAAKTAVDALP